MVQYLGAFKIYCLHIEEKILLKCKRGGGSWLLQLMAKYIVHISKQCHLKAHVKKKNTADKEKTNLKSFADFIDLISIVYLLRCHYKFNNSNT
jgi:hypothetical protein